MAEPSVKQLELAASFLYPRTREHPDAKVLGDVGSFEEGEGVRITLLPHYLLIEVETSNEGGELWLPITTLLHLIGEMHSKTGN